MNDIKTRVDDGVPWCDAGCPSAGYAPHSLPFVVCTIDERERCCSDNKMESECCHIAVRRMAVELEAWRSGRLFISWDEDGTEYYAMQSETSPLDDDFNTIEAAVDALMEEE